MPDDPGSVAGDPKAAKLESLYGKYDAAALDRGRELDGESFLRTVSQYDELDTDWTGAWLEFVYGRVGNRRILDEKTRTLIVVGQYIASHRWEHLQEQMKAAIRAGASSREVLEVCLHAPLYVGMPTLRHSLGAYRAVMTELGLATLEEPPWQYLRTSEEDRG
jgi:4-carboxymuconolactone decarboxylase